MRYGPMFMDCLLVARCDSALCVVRGGLSSRMGSCLARGRVGMEPCSAVRGSLGSFANGLLLSTGVGTTIRTTTYTRSLVRVTPSPMLFLGTVGGRARVRNFRHTVGHSKMTVIGFLH